MMLDCLDNKVGDGDLIMFAATRGRSAILKMAIVLDAEKMRVISAERWGDDWHLSSKPGTLQYSNKVLKINEGMINDEDIFIVLERLHSIYQELTA